jgi:FeS assembly protein IscX
MPSFDWENLDDIAIGLTDAHPDTDPYTVRFTDMHKWVTELPTNPNSKRFNRPGTKSGKTVRAEIA